MPKVLVPLAQGCEELEAVTIIDLLRRANITVVTAGLDGNRVEASRGTVLVPDMPLDEALKSAYDMVVLPGGLPGADNLGNDARVVDHLVSMAAAGQWVCAICAAPRVLARAGLLDGRRATGYPGIIDSGEFPKVTYTGAPVECDGIIITGRGPGTAMDFSLMLIEKLLDRATRDKVEQALVRP